MRVTLKQIAERAHVSINTVSIALRNMSGISDATKKQIFQIATEMGYFEQKRQTEALRNLCLIAPSARLRDPYFYMSFQQLLQRRIQEHGYAVLTLASEDLRPDLDGLQQLFETRAVCGILLLGDLEESLVQRIASCKQPVVMIGSRFLRGSLCTVIEDNLMAAAQAVQCLLDDGCKTLGFVGNPLQSTAFSERYYGFLYAAEQRGLANSQVCLLTGPDVSLPDQLAETIRRLPAVPEGFVCANDHLGVVLTKVLHAAGLAVPQDVSLVGIDNSPLGKLSIPSLTSVDVHCAQQADLGIRKLISFVHGAEYEPFRLVVPTTLVPGESTAKSVL